MSNPWLILFVAGLLETGWAVALKSTHGFTRFWPSVLTLALLAASLLGLARATEQLPIGTAYAVWVGIGAFGTAVFGIVFYGEPTTLPRLGFLAMLLTAIAGLKMSSGT